MSLVLTLVMLILTLSRINVSAVAASFSPKLRYWSHVSRCCSGVKLEIAARLMQSPRRP